MAGPLEGVRILDLTSVLMGPYATMILGDLGADVIKVEPPSGDLVRGIGPMRHPGMGAIFINANRSKRGIVLDLKHPDGQAALRDLSRTADVLFASVRPAAMRRLDLGYDDIRPINSRIVYMAIVGYGQSGPYAPRPAYDNLIQGAVAIPSLMTESGSQAPRYVPSAMVDRTVGLRAASSITAALFARERKGQGSISRRRCSRRWPSSSLATTCRARRSSRRSARPATAASSAASAGPTRPPTAMSALIYNDKQWQAFLRAIGRADIWDSDTRFATVSSQANNIDARRLSRSVAGMLAEGADPALQAAMAKDLGALLEQEIPEIA